MQISLNSLNWLVDLMQEPTWKLAGLLFLNFFWIPFLFVFLKEVWDAFQNWAQGIHSENNRKFVFLAIDVPRDTEETPMNMEAIFNQLAGAHGTQTWWESKWEGEFQEWFSFEIVSLEGYVQYIIRAPRALRDLVEAAVYAQYPNAEISEVSDYTQDVPDKYPNDQYELFGMEYLLDKPNAYPIKTYKDFEDRVRGEFVDPMAAMLEIMSKMGRGEQVWYQILAKPVVAEDWLDDAQKEIDKIVDRKRAEPKRGGIIGFFLNIPYFLTGFIDAIFELELGGEEEKKDDNKQPLLQRLTPGEADLLADMERKTGKLAYKCVMRVIYVARKEVYSKARGVGPVVGAIKQFNDDSRNWFKPGKHSWTKANYSFKKARVWLRTNQFIDSFKSRSMYTAQASGGYVLSSEELATVYHFPMMSVKAPLVKRTGAKKSEPPSTLPLGEFGGGEFEIPSAAPEPPSGTVRREPPAAPDSSAASEAPRRLSEKKEADASGMPIVDESDISYIEIPDKKDSTKEE